MSDIGSEYGQPSYGERGYRRRKLAEMAGSLYRTGQQAVTDMRESYAQTRARMVDPEADSRDSIHIPGAFPDAAITVQGNEQMVLFPSYAKRHIKRDWSQAQPKMQEQEQKQDGSAHDADYWHMEFQKHEDERAVADVDVRGWMYTPQSGPMTRRNRILIGLARQLSGISAPRAEAQDGSNNTTPPTHHQIHEEQKEQEKIDKEAAMIERKGRAEKQIAGAGGYSEEPTGSGATLSESQYPRHNRRRGSQTPETAPSSPHLGPRQLSNLAELSDAELALANANLMARIAPFMTNPMIGLAVTIFFYNEDQSQSRTVLTNDAGHFSVRAALDFVPTHVRVLVNENLSALQEVKIIERQGVSLISDIDDTIKKSNIASGTREIFRNTFVRELRDLTVEGVQEWYTSMHKLGVNFHYCSNSPWQLFPVLASFFKLGGLPPGSLHLKQYSGMLQGIFEPVAERKKGTLTKLLNDFPDRKFLLVGDSGEADLEVYTDLAVANPGRILAVFIRDVTTKERPGYFDSAYDMGRRDEPPPLGKADGQRQQSAPTGGLAREKSSASVTMGTLIDFSEDAGDAKSDDATALSNKKSESSVNSLGRKAAPPRPAKPAALRGTSSTTRIDAKTSDVNHGGSGPNTLPPRPPPPRRTKTAESTVSTSSVSRNSTSEARNETGGNAATNMTGSKTKTTAPPPPPLPRRRGVVSQEKSVDSDVECEPLPPATAAAAGGGGGVGGSSLFNYRTSPARSRAATPSVQGGGGGGGASPAIGAQAVDKKHELWLRRVARAQELLDPLGVVLYTWRRGQDVLAEAAGIIERALEDVKK